jgi:hypothetical protein
MMESTVCDPIAFHRFCAAWTGAQFPEEMDDAIPHPSDN